MKFASSIVWSLPFVLLAAITAALAQAVGPTRLHMHLGAGRHSEIGWIWTGLKVDSMEAEKEIGTQEDRNTESQFHNWSNIIRNFFNIDVKYTFFIIT